MIIQIEVPDPLIALQELTEITVQLIHWEKQYKDYPSGAYVTKVELWKWRREQWVKKYQTKNDTDAIN